MTTKLFETIYRQALPALEGRSIKDVRIGLGLLAVELDDGALAVSYVLRDELPPGCGVMPMEQPLRGMDAEEMAAWTFDYDNSLLTSLGLAVLNSVVDHTEIEHQSHDDLLTLLQPDDQVGMVGLIGPMVAPIQRITARKLYIFDRSRESSTDVYPETRQKELLPQCDVVFISGTATINRTLDSLLAYASNAREIILIGTSTPLYPEAFRATAVTWLAGSLWPKANRDPIFTRVGEGRGIQSLMRYGTKVTIKVPKLK
ncbi:MAG: hypothetical protein JW878_06270 [Methanomicrobia archaeon]|nr:hypothetical protein [Methanomicrobia archaeon]